jgi:hypothetical protein
MKKTNLIAYNYLPVILITIGIITASFNILKGTSHLQKHKFRGNPPDSTIVGTWIMDADSTSKLIFIDEHTCQRYHSNVLFETDTVIISNTSPQCGVTVPVTVNTTYMQLIDKANATNHYCFEITGMTSVSLAFRSVNDYGHVLLYYRP